MKYFITAILALVAITLVIYRKETKLIPEERARKLAELKTHSNAECAKILRKKYRGSDKRMREMRSLQSTFCS